MAGADAPLNDYLVKARELVSVLETGDMRKADDLLDAMSNMRQSRLFLELGKLTRTLHEALTNLQMDSRLARLTQQDMPDARNRLQYVVTKTEEAANRTLKAVEESIPVAKRLETSAQDHSAMWDKFMRREMDVQEFRNMSQTLRGFLGGVMTDTSTLSKNLTEVLMAQEFQDLTGQVINRVIGIVQEVEEGLVEMLRVVGQRMQLVEGELPKAVNAEGPQIDPKRAGVVANQDEVDDLLSSLGF
jgi:chemotaxis protein CheZ